MRLQDSKEESALGLALAGILVVAMAIFLGNVTANVQPKAPIPEEHPDVSSPYLQQKLPVDPVTPGHASPYPQPGK